MGKKDSDPTVFQAAVSQLNQPVPVAPVWWRALLLLLVLAPAGLALLQPEGVLVLPLLAVLLLHELGHLAAMWCLGVRDARILFLPFLESALPPAGSLTVWKRGLALLAGPLPGLVLSVLIQATARPSTDTLLGAFAAWLAIFNGANLLAIGAFDGGRLFDLLLYHRRYLFAGLVWAAVPGCLLFLGWWLSFWWFYVAAAVPLLVLPFHYSAYRIGQAAPLVLSADLGQLNEEQQRALFDQAGEDDPEAAVHAMLQLHERHTEPPPPLAGWLALVGLHLLGVLCGAACLVLQADDNAEALRRPVRAFEAYLEREADLSVPDAELQQEWQELLRVWREIPSYRRQRAYTDLGEECLRNPPALRPWSRLGGELGLEPVLRARPVMPPG